MHASNKSADLYIGLMSGTSIDGVDGVLAEFVDAPPESASGLLTARTLATGSAPFPAELHASLLALQTPAFDDLEAGARAGLAVAHVYASVVEHLLLGRSRAEVRAIGAHGQTVRHRPAMGYTLQLLSGAHLAEFTGVDVVCDFRSADMAAGGQGAPLVPAFHRGVFAAATRRRAIVNVGGIANVSLLAPGEAVLGYDTGPGNTLMDSWIHRHQGLPFDDAGRWAGSGTVNPRLLTALLSDTYFQASAPKSIHRDHFTLEWLDKHLQGETPAEVQATLCELTCVTIAVAVRTFLADEVYVCGGGARNLELMRRLQQHLRPAKVNTTDSLGIDPQSVEALAFAWLARQRLLGRPGNELGATGARGPRVLGAWYPATRS